MIDNKIVDLVDELLNCNKKLLWERTPIQEMFRVKCNNYYIEIEKVQNIDKFIFRIFTLDYNTNIITYGTNIDDEPRKYLFAQLYKLARDEAHNAYIVIDEIIKDLKNKE